MELKPVTRRNFFTASAALAGGAAFSKALGGAEKPVPEIDKPGKTPNTIFAINLEMWFRGPFEDRIRKAAELGYPSVEFWPFEGRDIDGIARLLREFNMTASQFSAWGFGTELNNPAAGADRFLKTIEASCAAAEKLPGCGMFTVVIGDDIAGLTKEAMHAAAIEKIKKAVPILEKHRKTIIVEAMNPFNHPGHCLYGSRDAIAICKAVGSPWVKLNWDLFHMQRYEGNLIDAMRKGKDHIGYLQLADSPDRNEPGTGEVNYTEVFKTIREIGYKHPVGLELSPRDGDVLRAARRVYAADTW